MGPCQSPSLPMTHRHRGQARLPQLIFSEHKNWRSADIQCGSGLARDGAVSVTIIANDPSISRASPATTGIFSEYKNWRSAEIHCGSEPARDGAVSVTIIAQ